jgi:hypothetical protein
VSKKSFFKPVNTVSASADWSIGQLQQGKKNPGQQILATKTDYKLAYH